MITLEKLVQKLLSSTILLPCISFSGVIEPDVRWSDPEVKVCFAPTSLRSFTDIDNDDQNFLSIPPVLMEWNNELMDYMRSTVESSYSENSTLVRFVGWNICTGDELLSTVYLFPVKGSFFEGVSTLGEHGKKVDLYIGQEKTSRYVKEHNPIKHPSLAIKFTKTNMKNLTYIILHEFGHLAGLRHEHIREEANRDVNCSYYGSSILRSSEDLGISARLAGAYDPYSIMNYCYRDYLNFAASDSQPALSDLDQITLRAMYLNLE